MSVNREKIDYVHYSRSSNILSSQTQCLNNAFVLLIRIDSILFRVYIKVFNNSRCVNNFQNYL